MKKPATISLITVLAALSASPTSSAATPSDFYCKKVDAAPVMYYEQIVRNCGAGATETKAGMCGVTAKCTYIGATSDLSKAIHALKSEDERAKYVNEKVTSEDAWLPTNLTCRGHASDAGFSCPDVQDCKGDVYFNAQPAYMKPERIKNMMEGRGGSTVVHPNSEAGGAL
jgi:hypothetical protein